eukprot:Hpha_TRINITY_DN6101_c0_g1::TRINITY_DN6101_c0_g1_i1::g.164900::m.164900
MGQGVAEDNMAPQHQSSTAVPYEPVSGGEENKHNSYPRARGRDSSATNQSVCSLPPLEPIDAIPNTSLNVTPSNPGRSPTLTFHPPPALGTRPGSRASPHPIPLRSRPVSPTNSIAGSTPQHRPQQTQMSLAPLRLPSGQSVPVPTKSPAIQPVPIRGGISGAEPTPVTPACAPAPASPQATSQREDGGHSLDFLPSAMARWVQIQRGMHTVEPQCTVLVQKSDQSQFTRNFIVMVFLLTQGSGKDKVFKLVQNCALLCGSLSSDEVLASKCQVVEAQLSKVRKGLRMFKSLSEISKILSNYEQDPVLRRIMYFGNISSLLYFLTDHLVGTLELSFWKGGRERIARAKWWKDVFSLLRLLTAFVVDTWYYRAGQQRIREARKAMDSLPPGVLDPDLATELRAALLHRDQLRRNYLTNSINLSLLLSAFNVPIFRRANLPLIALCGVVTALLGLYKLVRRVHENQLTLQFC